MRPEVEREGVHHFEWGQRPERWPHVSHMFCYVSRVSRGAPLLMGRGCR